MGKLDNSKSYPLGFESEGKLKVQKPRNVSFDELNLSSILRKKIEINEEEKLGDVIFFREVLENIPKKAKEALTDPVIQEAMKKQFHSLEKNKVWKLIRKRGEKHIGTRWHFALEYGPNGEVSRFKARFVAKSLSQLREGIFTKRIRPQLRCRP